MWKPNKNTLFFLVLANATLAGISLYLVNWEVFENATARGIYREIATSLIFFCLAIYFVFPYVKELKKE
jgi:hypothetical protein